MYKSNYTHPRWPHRLASVTSLWGSGAFIVFLIPDHLSRPFAAVMYSHVFWHFMYKFISVVVNTINLQTCFEQWLSSWVLWTTIQRGPPTVLDLDIEFFLKISDFARVVLESVLCLVSWSCISLWYWYIPKRGLGKTTFIKLYYINRHVYSSYVKELKYS